MNNKEPKELQDIKKLLVLQRLASDVRAAEIAEMLSMKESNFSRDFHARKLIKRLKQGEKHGKKRLTSTQMRL